MQTEPALTSTGIVAAISAIVAALVGFGVISWSGEQQGLFLAAIVALVGVVGPLAAGWFTRQNSTPLAAPKDEDGVALVRADGDLPHAQARSLKGG